MGLNLLDLNYNGVIYSKKNSKQIVRAGNRTFLVSNRNARQCEDDMVGKFALQVIKSKWKPQGKYSVTMHFFRKDNTRRDLDNLTTSVLDALVKAGALEDDNINYVHELHIYDLGVDKNNVGVHVQLEGIEDV